MKMSKRAEKKHKLQTQSRKLAALLRDPGPKAGLPEPEPEIVEDDVPKGTKGGKCNVTACQRPNSAIFLNLGMIGMRGTESGCWYCVDCATDIHMANRDCYERHGFSLFPTYKVMMKRYREIYREGGCPDDPAGYEDINQNPWGSSSHRDRDAYLEKQNEQAEE